MHIGFDAKRFFQNVTGLGNYSRSTVLGLAEYFPGHRYTLYTPRRKGPFCTMTLPEPVQVQEACLAGRAVPSLWRSLGIPARAKLDALDIYHGLSHELPLTRFPRGTRTVVTMHDLLFLTHPHLYRWADRKLYAWKYGQSCRRADLVVAISRKTAEDAHELFSVPMEKIRVVHQSCNPVFSAPLAPGDEERLRRVYDLPGRYVLFVGSLIPRKGVHTLISALAALSPADRPGLVVAGTGAMESELREQARAAGLEPLVRFLGKVPGADLPGLYRLASVFAYPSAAEGFGIPILEALTSRVPVVTSSGSCFAEAGGDAALYTAPGDTEQLADALLRALNDAELRERMIRLGVEHAAGFHLARTSANLMRVYEELAPGVR